MENLVSWVDQARRAPFSPHMNRKHYLRDASDIVEGLGSLNQRFAGKRVLLTGAAGFLGVQFTHYFEVLNASGLLSQPCLLTATDNFLRGRPAWIEELTHSPHVQIQQSDIVQQQEFAACDFIIHAASIASPIFYRKHPIETMDANVIGLRNLLNHAVNYPVEGFLFFSTSEIYGDPDPGSIPTPETYRGNVSCTGPRACYDESKRYGETLCVNFCKVHGLPVVSVRPFNNYGPGLRISDRRVLPDFFRDALVGRDIVILSDGRATRTFCYVADAIEGYLRALLLGMPGEAYNIGTESPEISMRELADQVISTTGSGGRVVYQTSDDREYTTDNPQRRCPDISKARKDLDYHPQTTLVEGLRRTFEFYQDHLDD